GGADRRAHRAPAQVDLGLRQVERVLALDRPGRHVVARGVARDLAEAVDHQGDLGFRHVEAGVGTHRDGLPVADDSPRCRLEEKLRPFGLIDLLVDVGRALALLDPRLAGRDVRDPGRPDLGPAVDRRQQGDVRGGDGLAVPYPLPDLGQRQRPQGGQRRYARQPAHLPLVAHASQRSRGIARGVPDDLHAGSPLATATTCDDDPTAQPHPAEKHAICTTRSYQRLGTPRLPGAPAELAALTMPNCYGALRLAPWPSAVAKGTTALSV